MNPCMHFFAWLNSFATIAWLNSFATIAWLNSCPPADQNSSFFHLWILFFTLSRIFANAFFFLPNNNCKKTQTLDVLSRWVQTQRGDYLGSSCRTSALIQNDG
ncbi:hypothetical protein Syun_019286 [Stephania yunnanensis]|uniref:Uncharacterized protein n=1 Tax=Stephania yunnanensis TaxID=152371 RepID=A0AAP0ITY4_9MAGN